MEDKIIKDRKREYSKKYSNTINGKNAIKRANKKYQQTEKYKEYKRKYYLRKKYENDS